MTEPRHTCPPFFRIIVWDLLFLASLPFDFCVIIVHVHLASLIDLRKKSTCMAFDYGYGYGFGIQGGYLPYYLWSKVWDMPFLYINNIGVSWIGEHFFHSFINHPLARFGCVSY